MKKKIEPEQPLGIASEIIIEVNRRKRFWFCCFIVAAVLAVIGWGMAIIGWVM